MKAGDSIRCPGCGEQTLVKNKTVISGWNNAETHLVCVLCGMDLGEPQTESVAREESGEASSRLAALLGGEPSADTGSVLAPDENYGRFCRNCKQLIAHPFQMMCARHNRPADPMGDCADFERKDDEL